jgi:hypothetical protein
LVIVTTSPEAGVGEADGWLRAVGTLATASIQAIGLARVVKRCFEEVILYGFANRIAFRFQAPGRCTRRARVVSGVLGSVLNSSIL